MPRQSQHQYEAFGASTTATWLTYGTASDCTRQHYHERASGHVSNAMVQKENSAGKKSVQKENSAERTQETTKTVENTHRSPWPLCSVTTVQKKKKKKPTTRQWRKLTEFLGHSVLLHEPEAQGAEGVAL